MQFKSPLMLIVGTLATIQGANSAKVPSLSSEIVAAGRPALALLNSATSYNANVRTKKVLRILSQTADYIGKEEKEIQDAINAASTPKGVTKCNSVYNKFVTYSNITSASKKALSNVACSAVYSTDSRLAVINALGTLSAVLSEFFTTLDTGCMSDADGFATPEENILQAIEQADSSFGICTPMRE